MKIVEKECYVPARTYIDKKYVASDGKEFICEIDCLEHERYLAIKSHPIYTTAIKDVDLFEEGYGATLYYLSSQEELYSNAIKGIDEATAKYQEALAEYNETVAEREEIDAKAEKLRAKLATMPKGGYYNPEKEKLQDIKIIKDEIKNILAAALYVIIANS